METLNVKKAVKKYGKTLIGRTIITQEEGSYPGGKAIVRSVHPRGTGWDVCKIHMYVHHIVGWKEFPDSRTLHNMGILHYEDIKILN